MSRQRQIRKQDNIFILKGSKQSYISDTVKVSFYHSLTSESSSYSSDQSSSNPDNKSIIPTFNFDRNTYTPSFYLPYKQIRNSKCLDKHHKKQQKYKEISEQSILVPKPRKRQYCHSCETTYKDYLQHINGSQHIENTTTHPVHYQIIQLCRKFQKTDEPTPKELPEEQKDSSND